jgi:hypothetical protein
MTTTIVLIGGDLTESKLRKLLLAHMPDKQFAICSEDSIENASSLVVRRDIEKKMDEYRKIIEKYEKSKTDMVIEREKLKDTHERLLRAHAETLWRYCVPYNPELSNIAVLPPTFIL